MNLSKAGLDLIKSFEGYHTRTPDGGCKAYRCPAGVLTIGYGCTKGVTHDLVWTKQQAEAQLMRELEEHERIVERCVYVAMTQGQFDALVSFNFNTGKLPQSTLLKKFNRGDVLGARSEFHKYRLAGGKVMNGLVRRRAAEAALFVSDLPSDDLMPQAAEPARSSPQPATAGMGGAVAGVSVAATVSQTPTEAITKATETITSAKGLGEAVAGATKFAVGAPLAVAVALACGAVVLLWPKIRERSR